MTEPPDSVVATERHANVLVLRLDRPRRRNALSARLCDAIHDTLVESADDEGVGAVVITGAAPTFSAGFDLTEIAALDKQAALVEASARYHRTVWTFPKPVVCAVNGEAMAGGFDLTTLCDLRIASTQAVFGHPEVKFGLPPLYTPLRWIVGDGHARELCLTGRAIDAAEAHRIGLVSRVVAPQELLHDAIETATAIAQAPASAITAFKKYASSARATFEESFVAEHDEPFAAILDGTGGANAHAAARRGAQRLTELH